MDIGAAANSSVSQMLVLQAFTQNLIAGKPCLHSCSFSVYSGMVYHLSVMLAALIQSCFSYLL